MRLRATTAAGGAAVVLALGPCAGAGPGDGESVSTRATAAPLIDRPATDAAADG